MTTAITVRIWNSKSLHIVDYRDPGDPRIGFTVCGLKFVWSHMDGPKPKLPRCTKCGPPVDKS